MSFQHSSTTTEKLNKTQVGNSATLDATTNSKDVSRSWLQGPKRFFSKGSGIANKSSFDVVQEEKSVTTVPADATTSTSGATVSR